MISRYQAMACQTIVRPITDTVKKREMGVIVERLSDNYDAAAQKELGRDYPKAGDDERSVPLAIWYEQNPDDVAAFEKQMRRKVHYVVQPQHLWASIANMARTQDGELLHTLQNGFKYIEEESFERAALQSCEAGGGLKSNFPAFPCFAGQNS